MIALTAEEAALTAELQKGSTAAYERLYREHGNRMKSIAANMLGNRQEAEDAVHDAFVKILRASGAFDGRCPVVCWVIRILVNTCQDRLRQRRPTMEPSPSLRSAPENPPLRATLERAIGRLPERQRTVFLLYEVEGFRHAEISSVLGEPETTIRHLLHEAKKTLRSVLRPAEAKA